MQFLYRIPGYALLLFGGFCLSWGGFIIRSFEEASVWQILLLRSIFFMVALTVFLISIYKKDTIKIIKDAGYPALLGGLVMSLSFIAFVVSMSNTTVANVVFIISTQTMFLAIFGYFYLKEKISLISFFSILLAMGGIIIMVGDSLSTGSFFGNIVALAIPINFSILVMVIRKNKNLDMVPAIFYSGFFSIIYGLILSESFVFTSHDILMGFFLGVPQLAFGFICITIGSRTTPSATIGLLMLTETLFAPLWVWLFLSEIPPYSVLIGGAIIILAIILKSLDKKKVVS
ncbi:DMT family transporter [Candidatus Pelagibacter bacterium]|jgi:drug/metabolite transporter, DME family|nr:DMT family transporter [Candidatus Pelagibacter bacterium]